MGLVASTWFSIPLRRVERFSSSYGTVLVECFAWVQQERFLAQNTTKLIKKHAKKMSPAMVATSANIMVLSDWSDGDVSGVEDVSGFIWYVEYVYRLVVPEGVSVVFGQFGEFDIGKDREVG